MKKLIFLLISSVLITNVSQAQESNVFLDYSMLEVEYLNLVEGGLESENIHSYVLGLNTILSLSEGIDLVGAVGISSGFDYRFVSTNLAFKLSSNFNLNLGGGLYMIDDKRWKPQGLEGQDPSSNDLGLNFGLACQLTDKLGVSIKYNIIEPKEEEGIGSMSINSLSFGIILK